MWAFIAGQGVLQARRARLCPEFEQRLPRAAAALVGRAARVEVEAGEDAVQAFHERRVLEGACCRRCADELGDVQVHAVEIRDAVLGGHRGAQEPHLLDDLRDGGRLVRRWADPGQGAEAVQGGGHAGDRTRASDAPAYGVGNVAEETHRLPLVRVGPMPLTLGRVRASSPARIPGTMGSSAP